MANQTQGGQQQPMVQETNTTIVVVQVQGESCRNNSRVVGWVDIVLGVVNMVCHAIVVYLSSKIFQSINSHNIKESTKAHFDKGYKAVKLEPSLILYAIWGLAIIGLFVSAVEIWLATELLSAANIRALPYLAIKKAKLWRICNICLLIFTLLCGGVNLGGRGYFFWTGGCQCLWFLIRCLFIYIVHSFIQELLRAGGGAPMVVAGGNAVAYTTSQYQQPPQNQQQQPQNQPQQPQNQPQQPQNQQQQQPQQLQQKR